MGKESWLAYYGEIMLIVTKDGKYTLKAFTKSRAQKESARGKSSVGGPVNPQRAAVPTRAIGAAR